MVEKKQVFPITTHGPFGQRKDETAVVSRLDDLVIIQRLFFAGLLRVRHCNCDHSSSRASSPSAYLVGPRRCRELSCIVVWLETHVRAKGTTRDLRPEGILGAVLPNQRCRGNWSVISHVALPTRSQTPALAKPETSKALLPETTCAPPNSPWIRSTLLVDQTTWILHKEFSRGHNIIPI